MSEDDRREHSRVPVRLRVNFRVMDAEEALEYIEQGDYKGLNVDDGESMDMPANALENETKDISLGGLSLGGDLTILGNKNLERGTNLAVEILVPGVLEPVKAIGVVVWAKTDEENPSRYECGLMFKGISVEDLDKLQNCIQRIQDNA